MLHGFPEHPVVLSGVVALSGPFWNFRKTISPHRMFPEKNKLLCMERKGEGPSVVIIPTCPSVAAVWSVNLSRTTTIARMGPVNRKDDGATAESAPRLDAEGVMDCKPPQAQAVQQQAEHTLRAPMRPPSVSPSASEWRELVTGLGSLRVDRQHQPECGSRAIRPRPKVHMTRVTMM